MFAYSNVTPGEHYKQQSAMTASPGELTLMLYDGILRFLKLSKMYIQEGNIEKSNDYLQRVQAIFQELISTLDTRYDLSGQLLSLYDFLLYETVQANLHKDTDRIDVVLEMSTELRDTWQQAIRLNRQSNNR